MISCDRKSCHWHFPCVQEQCAETANEREKKKLNRRSNLNVCHKNMFVWFSISGLHYSNSIFIRCHFIFAKYNKSTEKVFLNFRTNEKWEKRIWHFLFRNRFPCRLYRETDRGRASERVSARSKMNKWWGEKAMQCVSSVMCAKMLSVYEVLRQTDRQSNSNRKQRSEWTDT